MVVIATITWLLLSCISKLFAVLVIKTWLNRRSFPGRCIYLLLQLLGTVEVLAEKSWNGRVGAIGAVATGTTEHAAYTGQRGEQQLRWGDSGTEATGRSQQRQNNAKTK